MRRAKHNLSHYRITAGDFGKLYPVSSMEILPGDTVRCQSSALVRLQPLMTPLMHPVDISIASWFVPSRLLWSGFEAFITGRDANATVPTIAAVAENDVNDYLGCAISTNPINALPTRAYNLIFNEFYRDQDLDTERTEDDTSVANVRWTKDYFTTARTQPQKGDTVQISFSAGAAPLASTTQPQVQVAQQATGVATRVPAGGPVQSFPPDIPQNPDNTYDWSNLVWADLSKATGGIDINEWRRAMALQRFLEHRNKFGSRYKDMLAFLGVKSADGRLDRPEYLGGGRQTIAFSEVLQTVESSEVPLGTQGGHGIASIRTRPHRRMFSEHGYCVTLMSIRPRPMYLTATDRTFLRSTRDDFWQKENEMLGEQPVLKREIYGSPADPSTPFGYSPRHDDYRSQRSYATGDMRKSAYNTWHMAREFNTEPALNSEFVECKPTDRVFRSSNDPQFYAMVQNRVAARRLVSRYARN